MLINKKENELIILLLLLLILLRQFRYQPLRNLFQGQQDLLWLQRILLLPYLLRHTSGQRLFWRT